MGFYINTVKKDFEELKSNITLAYNGIFEMQKLLRQYSKELLEKEIRFKKSKRYQKINYYKTLCIKNKSDLEILTKSLNRLQKLIIKELKKQIYTYLFYKEWF